MACNHAVGVGNINRGILRALSNDIGCRIWSSADEEAM